MGPYELSGLGIEKLVHANSLAKVIEKVRQMALGKTMTGSKCRINVKHGTNDSQEIFIWVYPLNEPDQTFLVLGNTNI